MMSLTSARASASLIALVILCLGAGCGRPVARTVAKVTASPGSVVVPRIAPPTITVKAGESIQDAVDGASEGDIIGIEPGVYRETVLVETSNITLRGLRVAGERPLLDGTRVERGEDGKTQLRGDAVQGKSIDNFVVEGLRIENYQGNGVLVNDCNGIVMRDLVIRNTGLYGLYPVGCRNVLIEDCVVSEVIDAGIYVGQSEEGVVRNNECFKNVAGLEIENSSKMVVENNSCHHNTAGLLVFVLPNLKVKTGADTIVRGNRVWANNVPNFGPPGSIVGTLPYGCGIMVLAADRTLITDNDVWDNDSFGTAVLSMQDVRKKDKFDIEPHSDGTRVEGNRYANNGSNPHPDVKKRMIPVGTDLVWNGEGKDNCWIEATTKRFPPVLPQCN